MDGTTIYDSSIEYTKAEWLGAACSTDTGETVIESDEASAGALGVMNA